MNSNTKIVKTVYFVRHGQSVDNAAPVFQASDSPLSEKGIGQAEATAERLSNLAFDALIASPLPRARQTAEHIAAKTNKQIETSALLVERTKPSGLDGKPWGDNEAEAFFKDWEESLYTADKRVADGENYADLIKRADDTLQMLQSRSENTIVVVTHGFFLSVLVARVLLGEGLSPEMLHHFRNRIVVDNTSITAMRYTYDYHDDQDAWRLWIFNDHSHFAD